MMKRLLTYMNPLIVYIFLPGISQQIFMDYDDYYFYIIILLLLMVNLLFAFNFLKLPNKLSNFIAAVSVTSIGILSVIVVMNLHLGWEGIKIALFCNAISSIIAWEVVFQLNKKKKAANSHL